jgi:hypothetical protein
MNKRSTYRILGVLLIAWGISLEVQAAPRAQVSEYGYYRFIDQSLREPNSDATSGYVTSGKAQLVERTTRIPIEKGRLFGFRFSIWGVDGNIGTLPLQLVVTHPLMKKPDGSESTGYSYVVNLNLKNGAVEDQTGYHLNEDFELVEGDWQFEYRFMNKPLLVQKFTTYRSAQ